MPGVLIVEAMAQCGAILALRNMPDRDNKLFFFGGIDKARFQEACRSRGSADSRSHSVAAPRRHWQVSR